MNRVVQSLRRALRNILYRHWVRHPLRVGAAFAFIVWSVQRVFAIDFCVVVGRSMLPTLQPTQLICIDPTFYEKQQPAPGDVVVAHVEGESIVKRIAAVGKQSVWVLVPGKWQQRIDSSCPVIAPEKVPDVMRREKQRAAAGRKNIAYLASIKVPPGHVFLLGDNETVSRDSRDFGPVPLTAIRGRVLPVKEENGQ